MGCENRKFLIVLFCLALVVGGCGSDEIQQQLLPLAPSAPSLEQHCPPALYKNTSQMRYIPNGSFTMGGAWETDAHRTPEWLAETDAFYMDIHEVTIGDFLYFMDMTGHKLHELPHNPSIPNIDDMRREDHNWSSPEWDYYAMPVMVSWYDAVAYATWVGKRLPTEIEWEKAARGGIEGAQWSWGYHAPTKARMLDPNISRIQTRRGTMAAEGAFVIAELSNRSPVPWDDGFMFTSIKEGFFALQPVMSYKPNDYGLFDMIGNVDEWCSDVWNTNAYLLLMNDMTLNPTDCRLDGSSFFTKDSNIRVVRGGGIRHNVDMVSKYSGVIKDMEVDKQGDFLQSTIHVGERGARPAIFAVGFRCVLDVDDTWTEKSWTLCP